MPLLSTTSTTEATSGPVCQAKADPGSRIISRCGYRRFDHELKVGERIILEDMIHYTIVKTNMFNGIQHPSIALLHMNGELELYREFEYADYKNRMS